MCLAQFYLEYWSKGAILLLVHSVIVHQHGNKSMSMTRSRSTHRAAPMFPLLISRCGLEHSAAPMGLYNFGVEDLHPMHCLVYVDN